MPDSVAASCSPPRRPSTPSATARYSVASCCTRSVSAASSSTSRVATHSVWPSPLTPAPISTRLTPRIMAARRPSGACSRCSSWASVPMWA